MIFKQTTIRGNDRSIKMQARQNSIVAKFSLKFINAYEFTMYLYRL